MPKWLKKASKNLWVRTIGVVVTAVAVGLIAHPYVSKDGEAIASDFAADQSQALAIEDGVSEGEYDSAVMRTLACVRQAGGVVTDLRKVNLGGKPTWLFTVTTKGDGPGSPSVYDECWMKYSRDVEVEWSIQHQPSAEQREQNEARAAECAREEGLGVDTFEGLKSLALSELDHDKMLGTMRCMAIGMRGFDPRDLMR